MTVVTKGDRTMTLHDGVQVAAFKKSGWAVGGQRAPEPPVPEPELPEPAETPESSPEPSLKEQADALGIKYHPNIGDEKLAEKIAAAKEGEAE